MKGFYRNWWTCIPPLVAWMLVTAMLTLCASCARVQYLPVEERRDSTMNGNILANSSRIDSLSAFLRESENRTSEKLSEIVVNSNTVYWSAPDSSGRQYREKENTTVINNTERDFSSLERLTEGHYRQLSGRIDSLSVEIKRQGGLKKVSAPSLTRWQRWKQTLGGYSMIAIIITVLVVVGKRVYRLIK